MNINKENIIVVFDGYCILCNSYINWFVQKDIKQKVYFTTFESEFVKKNYPKILLKDTINVIDENGTILIKSRAIMYCLEIIEHKNIFLKLLKIIPYKVSDIIYQFISNYRYKLFGRKKNCSIPNKIISSRVLE